MKRTFIYILAATVLTLSAGCEKDNYDPPSAFINGKIVYENQALQLRNAENQLELWQEGYDRKTKIPVYINQDGTFSANVFEGTYKLVLLRGVGPWVNNSDSLIVDASGSSTVDVPVTPYFVIADPSITKTGNQVTATCNIQKISTTANVERLILCLGSTNIVDINNQEARIEKDAAALAPGNEIQTISIDIPERLVQKGYVYARIGVKTAGVEQLIYSPVQKL